MCEVSLDCGFVQPSFGSVLTSSVCLDLSMITFGLNFNDLISLQNNVKED